MTTVYEPRAVNRRRRTNAQLDEVDAAIVAAVEIEQPVTLRGVYYRVVTAGAIEKTDAGYQVIKRQLLKLRRNAAIPYDHIVDGTRQFIGLRAYDDLDQALDDMAASYRRRLWHDQGVAVVMLAEKDAIRGVVEPKTLHWDVPFGVMRGYASESFAYDLALRIRNRRCPVYVYHLGDHDPSGVDAWRDLQAKVVGFLEPNTQFLTIDDHGRNGHLFDDGSAAYFERLAVTPEQIEAWDLPTRPTKASDTRAAAWSGGSVEVDAIPPTKLRELVEDAVTQHIDQDALRLTRLAEREERAGLYALKGRRNPASSHRRTGDDLFLAVPDEPSTPDDW